MNKHPNTPAVSETPLTDAAASDGWSGDAICVSDEFARCLEKQVADLTRINEKLRRGLRQALRQWEGFSSQIRGSGEAESLEESNDLEALIYQECKSLIATELTERKE